MPYSSGRNSGVLRAGFIDREDKGKGLRGRRT